MQMILRTRETILMAALSVSVAADLRGADWTHLAQAAERPGSAAVGPQDLAWQRWRIEPDLGELFVSLSSPLVCDDLVIVTSRVDGGAEFFNRVIAFERGTGARCWEAEIESDLFDSWATPAIDAARRRVYVASGFAVYAIDLDDGAVVWDRPTDLPLVNASPAVTTDLETLGVPSNRVLITDYDTVGSGQLYAINVDPFHPTANPWEPGEVVWTAPAPGAVGATPAIAGETAIIAVSNTVRAVDVRSGQAVWTTPIGGIDGFFGGASVRSDAVFAAAYNFSGGQNNTLLVKLDLVSGDVRWTVPCERTDSIPIVGDDGLVLLAGGIDGFGSAIKVQAFQDQGDHAMLIWDTHVDSGGAVRVGGWTHHPVRVGDTLFVGTPGGGGLFGPYQTLVALDLTTDPSRIAFVSASADGAGGSPAIDRFGNLYSLGVAGLTAFGARTAGDMNCDGALSVGDINPFVQALSMPEQYAQIFPTCDPLNGDFSHDGQLSVADINGFVEALTDADG